MEKGLLVGCWCARPAANREEALCRALPLELLLLWGDGEIEMDLGSNLGLC